MTPLTRVKFHGNSRLLLRPVILTRIAVVLFAAIVPAMALTYLRFQTRDLEIETSKLQKKRQMLIAYKSGLVSQVEELKRYDRMKEYAQSKLGLQESAPEQVGRIALSAEAVSRWNEVIDKSARSQIKTPQSTERLIAVVGERVISWSSVSMAREPLDRAK